MEAREILSALVLVWGNLRNRPLFVVAHFVAHRCPNNTKKHPATTRSPFSTTYAELGKLRIGCSTN